MSNSRLNGLMINRLLVLIQIFLIPLYFIFFTIIWHSKIALFFENIVSSLPWITKYVPSWFISFEINLAIPIFFSLPWVLISIIKANRIANAYELMGRALGKVRIDQKLFYGLNASFALIFLILPFGSPLITIIGVFIVIRMIMRKLLIGRLLKLTWLIPSLIISIIPGLIALAFYSNYQPLLSLIELTWFGSIDSIFAIGLCLAISISIGNFFLFLFEGRSKYEANFKIPYDLVILIKAVLFTVLLVIYFNSKTPIVINWINYLAVVLAFFELFERWRHNMTKEGEGGGFIMVIIFSLVNIFISYIKAVLFFKTLVIVVASLIFFALFALSYKYANDEELFLDKENNSK